MINWEFNFVWNYTNDETSNANEKSSLSQRGIKSKDLFTCNGIQDRHRYSARNCLALCHQFCPKFSPSPLTQC